MASPSAVQASVPHSVDERRRLRAMDERVRRFIGRFNQCTRSGYRWRFRKFAQYLGYRPHEVSRAILRLVDMPEREAKPKALAFLPWLRSRGYPMLSGGSGLHGITPFLRDLEREEVVTWRILYPKAERQEEAWSRCTAAYKRRADQWLEFLRSLPLLPDTISKHRTQLLHLGLFLRAKRLALGTVTYSHLMRWLTELRNASVRPGTIDDRLSTARRFFRWLHASGHISGTPFSGIGPLRLPARLPRLLSKQEAIRVVRAARGARDRAIATLLYVTGCRAGELTGLDMADVSLSRRAVTYRGPYGPASRTVPLGPEGFAAVRALVTERRLSKWPSGPKTPLFLNSKGHRLTAPMLQRIILGLGTKARVGRHVAPKLLRHSFGAHFLANGGDVLTLRAALGLATLAAAHSYRKLAVGRLRDIYERTHPRK